MSEIRVAARYAKSLLELAEERGVLELVHEDMLTVADTCEKSKDLRLMLRNPIIGSATKLKVLNKIFGSSSNKLTIAFYELITRKGREVLLEEMAKAFHQQYNEKKQIQTATVITPFELNSVLREAFREMAQKISGKKIELKEQVDTELIGGYILRINDRQIDTSISSRLKELKVKFSENPYVKEF